MKIVADAKHEPLVLAQEGAERRLVSYGGMTFAQATVAAGVRTAIHSHPSRSGRWVQARST